jgi:hypothetical protein
MPPELGRLGGLEDFTVVCVCVATGTVTGVTVRTPRGQQC